MFFTPILQVPQQDPGTGGLLFSMLPFILIIVIFYFFIIRPQNKKQKETEKMIAALKKGDKVVTIGGIHGTVTSTKEQTVVIRVDDNAKIEFSRSAIASVVVPENKKATKEEKKPVEDKKAEEPKESVEETKATEEK